MPIATKCPGCKALFRLADDLAGKKVRCQKCAQMFAVPTPKSAAPVAQPPQPAAPIPAPTPAPPISMSLDDPPFAEEKILDAILVEEPKPEVIEAKLAEAPPEIVDATLAEEAPATSRHKPKPPRSAPRPRRSGDLPRHSTFGYGVFAFLALVVMGVLIIGCFVGTWAVINRDKAPPKKFIGPGPGNAPIAKEIGDNSQPLVLDADGKANVEGKVLPGAEIVYRVAVTQNQRYHILVCSDDMHPEVSVREGGQLVPAVANTGGGGRVLLSFTANRTVEHTIHVKHRVLKGGDFTLRFTRVVPMAPVPINLDANKEYRAERTLRLEDEANASVRGDLGPCHKYLLHVKPGEKYHFKIMSTDIQPALRLQHGVGFVGPPLMVDLGLTGYDYTAPDDVAEVAVFVACPVYGRKNLLGKYTLHVVRTAEADKPGYRTVAFAVGDLYHRDDKLTVQDPRTVAGALGDLGHAKIYLIPMEKGLGYNIDMKSKELDAHLALIDPQGKLVAKDDDSGGDFNARMLFDPKSSGQYRLLASDVKKGTGAFSIDIRRIKLPATTAVNQPLATMKRQEAGCEIVQANSGSFLLASSFAWAPDGKAFFVVNRFGAVHRFSYPELVEECHLITAPASIHMTAEGLLVSVLGAAELWLLDPHNLQLKRRLPRVGATVLAAPSLSHIYVTATFNKAGGGQAPGLIRHDLASGETLSFPFLKYALNTQFMAITPDGRHLLGSDGDNHMVRWRVQDREIITEETGTRVFRGLPFENPPLVLNADGKLLLHPVYNRLEIKPEPASDFAVAAYRANDFKEPVFVLDTGSRFTLAGFDPRSGLICVHTKTKGFVLADAQGKIVRELAISTLSAKGTKLNREITRLAFHPEGGKLLAFFDSTVMSITLPKDLTEKIEEKEK